MNGLTRFAALMGMAASLAGCGVGGGADQASAPGSAPAATLAAATGSADCGGVLKCAPPVALTPPDALPPAPGQPTSDGLIGAALTAGTIDAETALVYRVYAAFRDPRLPAQYTGDDSGAFESTAVGEMSERFDTLAPASQDALARFLRRPSSVGSWMDPAVRGGAASAGAGTLAVTKSNAVRKRPGCLGTLAGWTATDLPTAPARVWHDSTQAGHADVAARVAQYLENDVWPGLVGALGFKPPLDDSAPGGCDGGNGKLDLYIVPSGAMSDRGQTLEAGGTAFEAPVYLLIRDAQSDDQLRHTVSHEFAHAIQWAYRTNAAQRSYGWFREAFGNWGTDQVYPGNVSLNRMASCHFNSAFLSLDSQSTGACFDAPGVTRDHGAHLVLQYLSKTGSPTVVRAIVEATGVFATAVAAIDSTVAGGFRAFWPLFARKLWNQDPVLEVGNYFDWEQFTVATPVVAPALAPDRPLVVPADLGILAEDSTELSSTVNNLSVRYYEFSVADVDTRSLMFHNTFYPLYKAGREVSVRAFWKPEGLGWVEEDWTAKEWIGLCRDVKTQRIDRLVVVVASAETSGPAVVASSPPELKRNVIGCWGFVGSVKRTDVLASWSSGKVTASAVVRFDYHPTGLPNQYSDPATGRLRVPIAAPLFRNAVWTLIEGYIDDGCSYQLSASGTDTSIVLGGLGHGNLVINNFLESLPASLSAPQVGVTGSASRAYFLEAGSQRFGLVGTVTGREECGTIYQSAPGLFVLSRDGPVGAPVIGRDGLLKGVFVVPNSTDSVVFTWELAPIRQP